jgi:hypothetical protein
MTGNALSASTFADEREVAAPADFEGHVFDEGDGLVAAKGNAQVFDAADPLRNLIGIHPFNPADN